MIRNLPFDGPVESNRRPKGPIRPVTVHWRANGTTPPVILQSMPDRVPASHNWSQVIVLLMLLVVIGAGLWGRG